MSVLVVTVDGEVIDKSADFNVRPPVSWLDEWTGEESYLLLGEWEGHPAEFIHGRNRFVTDPNTGEEREQVSNILLPIMIGDVIVLTGEHML